MYTNFTLIALGLLGVLSHNLVELAKINRATNGKANIVEYLKIEKFSVILSVIIVCIAILAKQEISQLEQIGKWLGLGFMAIGYMGQSLLVFFMGKASKQIGKDEN
jgi:hypothetical protein